MNRSPTPNDHVDDWILNWILRQRFSGLVVLEAMVAEMPKKMLPDVHAYMCEVAKHFVHISPCTTDNLSPLRLTYALASMWWWRAVARIARFTSQVLQVYVFHGVLVLSRFIPEYVFSDMSNMTGVARWKELWDFITNSNGITFGGVERGDVRGFAVDCIETHPFLQTQLKEFAAYRDTVKLCIQWTLYPKVPLVMCNTIFSYLM